ncbi:uncharacterized protein BT62DRAFT_1003965 [Guyanagaster necrorhizus]|uniref:WW domain-containing protein n=1 Tax=Guyanagaster necrorhizus TaxID=856835 RepID=A0A9P8AU72_9AGAR|nr:uncharacterized protein BT62DRAFT_1003965 [Guyanagaster necrorhizus MCA 3950]KAG7448173.1 hypothetical protein BT62DRAFT_1003965 [Guyanagaster necrorhizus MCA 3950]
MSTTSTFKKGGSRSKQQARTRSRWILRLWNQRNNSDTCSSQAVSTTEYDADSVGLELSFPARSSPSSSLTAIDSQEQHHPHLSVVPSISSLAAPSGDETDTPDKDHVSASSCSHVARNISEIAEREVTTVASSSNPASYASAEAIEQDVSRQLVSHSDNSSRGYQISPSPRVGDDDSGVATSIPHIVVSEDISPRAAEASQPTTRVMRSSQTPLCLPTPEATTSEAVAQVAESSESISLPRRSAVNHTYDWSTDQREFEECIPSHIGHYNRKTHIDEMTVAEFTVPAMQTDFNTYRPILPQTEGEEVLTAGWTKHTHSDGKPYFYHDHDKIITEEWLYDRAIAERISRYISILNDAISKRSESFGRVKSWHLYVEITEPARENDNCTRCRYYFVNHDAECIFWLSQCPLDGYLWELRGDISPDLIRRFLQREYWNHHYFFSELHLLTKAQWNSVQKTILLAEADVTMSDTSTVAWSIEKLKNMSESIIKAESKVSHFSQDVTINGILFSELDVSEPSASCMASLLHDQILNYVGQRDVRTNRDESVYGNDYSGREPTVPFRIMNLLLFYAPIKHYIFLNKIWVDRIISRGQWQYLIEQTTNKWQQHVGLATILLAVNMGFLAIPSVDKMVETQTLCYLSVASSMGTIVIGLLLVNHHNSMKDVNVGVVASFLERHWQLDLGFERLSIMYSIPYALLMWG